MVAQVVMAAVHYPAQRKALLVEMAPMVKQAEMAQTVAKALTAVTLATSQSKQREQ